jgi:hypothetical protein
MNLDHISNAALKKLVAALASANTAPPVIVPATIAADTSLSPAVTVPKGTRLWAMALPAAWTASKISYQISFDGAVWFEPIDYSAGTPLVETAHGVGGTAFLTSSFTLLRCSSIRVRSGSASEPMGGGLWCLGAAAGVCYGRPCPVLDEQRKTFARREYFAF